MPRNKTILNLACVLTGITAVTGAQNLLSDSVENERNILCTVLETHVCVEAAGCVDVLAEEMNIPRFVRIDTKTGKVATTRASGENRETTAGSVNRAEGRIVLQGVEDGRAFSMYVEESTGLSTFAAAAAGRSVTAFAVCTPLPVE